MGCSNADHRPGGFLDAQIKGRIMKTTITAKSESHVIISYDVEDYSTESGTKRVTRKFTRPARGGYVIEWLRNSETTQVCDKLSHRGSTLYCGENTPLVNIIRCEYQAMRREEKRFANSY